METLVKKLVSRAYIISDSVHVKVQNRESYRKVLIQISIELGGWEWMAREVTA